MNDSLPPLFIEPNKLGYRNPIEDPVQPVHELELECADCGACATYDVGVVYIQQALDEEGEVVEEGDCVSVDICFTKYFRCRKCSSPGPFSIIDMESVLEEFEEGGEENDGRVRAGTTMMEDGVSFPTPAMSEEYFLDLIKEAPDDPSLSARLANLYRIGGVPDRAIEWYEKVISLDPLDTESRFHLFVHRVAKEDFASAAELLGHIVACSLDLCPVYHLMEKSVVGCVLDRFTLMEKSRRELILNELPETCDSRVREVLLQACSDSSEREQVVDELVFRLLSREFATEEARTEELPALKLNSALGEVVLQNGLHPEFVMVDMMQVPLLTNSPGEREVIGISDLQFTSELGVTSIRELFRGESAPPPDHDEFFKSYFKVIMTIERSILVVADGEFVPTDQEILDAFSQLRRRPDGKSSGALHDFMWQVLALMLSMHELSQEEYEEILLKLESSVKRLSERPVSRNYIPFLESQFGDDDQFGESFFDEN